MAVVSPQSQSLGWHLPKPCMNQPPSARRPISRRVMPRVAASVFSHWPSQVSVAGSAAATTGISYPSRSVAVCSSVRMAKRASTACTASSSMFSQPSGPSGSSSAVRRRNREVWRPPTVFHS